MIRLRADHVHSVQYLREEFAFHARTAHVSLATKEKINVIIACRGII